jgi:hypothetical protein
MISCDPFQGIILVLRLILGFWKWMLFCFEKERKAEGTSQP